MCSICCDPSIIGTSTVLSKLCTIGYCCQHYNKYCGFDISTIQVIMYTQVTCIKKAGVRKVVGQYFFSYCCALQIASNVHVVVIMIMLLFTLPLHSCFFHFSCAYYVSIISKTQLFFAFYFSSVLLPSFSILSESYAPHYDTPL